MADGTTVDSLQIEIEASSAEAEKRVDALAAALERLKKATTGFGNVSDRIRDIGASASESPAAEKTKQRKEALDRATEEIRPRSVDLSQTAKDARDIASTISSVSKLEKELERTKKRIIEIKEAQDKVTNEFDYQRQFPIEFQHPEVIEDLRSQFKALDLELREADDKAKTLSKTLDSLRGKVYTGQDLGAVKEEPVRTVADAWADIKAQMQGTKLGDIIGDTSSIDEAVGKMVELGDQTSILQIKLEGLQEKLRGAFEKGNQSQVANYTAQIQKLKDQLSELQNPKESGKEKNESETSLLKKLNILVEIKKALKNIKTGNLEGIVSGFNKLSAIDMSSATSGVKSFGSAFSGLVSGMSAVLRANPEVAAALLVLKVAIDAIRKVTEAVVSTIKNFVSTVKKFASVVKDALGTVFGGIASGAKSIGKSLLSHFTKPFTGAIGAFLKWKNAIGRIAFYRAVREAVKAVTDGFKTGMDNLYQYSRLVGTEFAPAMNSLATSALYLKNSLGAMAAPLIQALAPAVDFLIDKFVALINVIGKAFAVLTGKSVYTQAKKHAVDYADAANSASKATQKFLLGIDELNILDNPAGGGASALEDYGSMFEEVEVPADQFDWVKQIREAIENGEWRSVGELVANKLNEIVDSWDSYGWGAKLGGLINNGLNVAYGFLTTFDFKKFGSKVADGLNGLFDTVDWDLLGRTFAAKWNALFDFIYGFATTLKWHEIGLDISQAINGFLDELDPSKAAQAVSAFATGLFDMLNTAIAETNWNVLGDKLGQFISEVDWQGAIYGALSIVTNGLSALKEGLDSFLRSWTWQDTAQQTYTAVNQAFSDVDWGGLGNTLGNAFTTAFNFLRETIAGIEWASIGSDIAAFFNGIDWAGLLSGVATTIAAAFNAVVSTLSALVQDLEWEEVGKAVGNAINDFFATFDWVSFFTGLAELASGVMNGISAALETIDWDAAWASVKEGLDAVDWGSLVESAGRLIVDAFVTNLKLKIIQGKAFFSIGGDIIGGLLEGIVDGVKSIGEWLKTNLVDPIVNGVKGLFGIHSPSTVFAEIGGFLIAGLLEGVSQAWNSIVDFFGSGIETLKTNFSQGWENIKATASAAWEAIKTNLGTTWEGIKTSAGEKFTAVKESVSTAWENVKTATGEKWESIKSTLFTTWENLKTTAGTTFENIKSTVAEKWESIKTDTGEKWDRVKSTLSEAWDNMKSTASSKLAEIKSSVSDTWGNIVSSAVSWGKDLCSNLAEGIRGGISKVTSAVSSVASKVRDFLHFTEPDVGPLSDFHTYMPDMLELMSKGIKDNTYKAVNATSELADAMSRTLGNIEPVEPKFSVHEDLFASVQPHYSGANTDTVNVSPQSNESPDSMEVINAMFAVGQQIVNAINETSDRPINIDWSSVASGMTSMQNRQNMMYGKTLQNY